jgi:hypothetical protein
VAGTSTEVLTFHEQRQESLAAEDRILSQSAGNRV